MSDVTIGPLERFGVGIVGILGIRLIHHGKIRIQPDGFPIGAKQPIGDGMKGAIPSVRLPVSPNALLARRNISSEALRVNVRSMIRPGSIPCDTSQATRAARVLVLPVPAPAMVRTGPLAHSGSAKLFGVQIVNPEFGHGPSRIRTVTPDVQPLRERLK